MDNFQSFYLIKKRLSPKYISDLGDNLYTSICFPYALPQHFLYFFPLPHGQGSFRPITSPLTIG